jgi:hypothetical protein
VTRLVKRSPKHLEADDEIGPDRIALAAADAGRYAPGQEFRVALDIRDKVEELVGGKGRVPLLRMSGHSLPRVFDVSRLSRAGKRRLPRRLQALEIIAA